MRRALLELLIPSVCPGCDTPRREGDRLLCAPCGAGLELWPQLGAIHTAIAYRGTGRRLLQRFKFAGRRDALEVLVEPIAWRLEQLDFGVIVPIPRHPERLREQRADPVHALAKRLARELRRPLADVLERRRPTRLQSGLRPDERRANVQDSFRLGASLAGVDVLLLDDIATTGATLMAAADELRRTSGARSVACAALAGTPPGGLPLPSSDAAAL